MINGILSDSIDCIKENLTKVAYRHDLMSVLIKTVLRVISECEYWRDIYTGLNNDEVTYLKGKHSGNVCIRMRIVVQNSRWQTLEHYMWIYQLSDIL